jgi:hypothetical protein
MKSAPASPGIIEVTVGGTAGQQFRRRSDAVQALDVLVMKVETDLETVDEHFLH